MHRWCRSSTVCVFTQNKFSSCTSSGEQSVSLCLFGRAFCSFHTVYSVHSQSLFELNTLVCDDNSIACSFLKCLSFQTEGLCIEFILCVKQNIWSDVVDDGSAILFKACLGREHPDESCLVFWCCKSHKIRGSLDCMDRLLMVSMWQVSVGQKNTSCVYHKCVCVSLRNTRQSKINTGLFSLLHQCFSATVLHHTSFFSFVLRFHLRLNFTVHDRHDKYFLACQAFVLPNHLHIKNTNKTMQNNICK